MVFSAHAGLNFPTAGNTAPNAGQVLPTPVTAWRFGGFGEQEVCRASKHCSGLNLKLVFKPTKIRPDAGNRDPTAAAGFSFSHREDPQPPPGTCFFSTVDEQKASTKVCSVPFLSVPDGVINTTFSDFSFHLWILPFSSNQPRLHHRSRRKPRRCSKTHWHNPAVTRWAISPLPSERVRRSLCQKGLKKWEQWAQWESVLKLWQAP